MPARRKELLERELLENDPKLTELYKTYKHHYFKFRHAVDEARKQYLLKKLDDPNYIDTAIDAIASEMSRGCEIKE